MSLTIPAVKTPPVLLAAPHIRHVVLAVSAHYYTFPAIPDWVTSQKLALEYSPNPADLTSICRDTAAYLEQGVPIRYHAYFPQYEIADADPLLAKEAVDFHLRFLRAMHGIGEQHATLHIGLTPGKPISRAQAINSLTKIVDYAADLGISIALENLKRGVTSDPFTVVDWCRQSGAGITLDVGHAVSCAGVARGDFSVTEIIDLFSDYLQEVHLYERETDRHHAPADMSILGEIVDRLLTTSCPWWTIELESIEDIATTRDLVFEHCLTKA